MLQVRAGHCPNCKESVPPGADFCPVCGENLNWQTVDGKTISGRTRGQNKARDLVRNLIFLLAFSLFALVALALFQRAGQKPPTANAVTTKPKAGSTPASSDDANSMADNALSEGQNSATNSVDNSASDSADNAVSHSVDNVASNSASTPESESSPQSQSTPQPTNADDLSDIENQ